MSHYVIGVDFGTDSVRSLVVDASNGKEISIAVSHYKRWGKGLYCNPSESRFRQHPQDYIDGIIEAVKESIKGLTPDVVKNIKGLSIDTTGSTPCAVDKQGMPLALSDEFAENPNAMFILWKDHTSVAEAEAINKTAHSWGGIDFTKYSGGIYSSEWFWAKILHVLRTDKKVADAAFSWMEHCDWMPALLTGMTDPLSIKRSRCAAGHKGMWHKSFGGLPSEEFLVKVDPSFKGLRTRLYTETYTSDEKIGTISKEWANRLGLPEDIVIGVGALDAHFGCVGGGIEPYALAKIMGTSTCDMLIAPEEELGDRCVKGICGQVDGSILPGKIGMEAGQSAFGDIYAWFKNILAWPVDQILSKTTLIDEKTREKLIEEMRSKILGELTKAAEKLPIEETGIVALDWLNGRRTPDANQLLKAAIAGLTLGSSAPGIFRSLVEASAFGAKMIVDRFEDEGIKIRSVVALGGIPKKSAFVMQITADVFNREIKVSRSEQSCALGAAMFAAVISGAHKNVEEAQLKMSSGFDATYTPIQSNVEKYKIIYERYKKLGSFVEKETGK
jgi:L-ribulokinase